MVRSTLTPEQFQALSQKLAQDEGITLAGTGGLIDKNGGQALWKYDGAELEIKVIHAPFPASIHFVESHMVSALQQEGYTAEVVG